MLTDEQLMERLQQGNTQALNELYQRYARKLYVFCANTTRSITPEDVVHDVFLRVIEAAGKFNPKRASFCTWLFRIARNRCIDLNRRDKKITTIPAEENPGQPDYGEKHTPKHLLVDASENVEESMIRASVFEAVRECISELNHEEERQAIMFYYLGNKVYREIGEIFGKSTSMAKNYVKSAQKKIKRCLERKSIESFS